MFSYPSWIGLEINSSQPYKRRHDNFAHCYFGIWICEPFKVYWGSRRRFLRKEEGLEGGREKDGERKNKRLTHSFTE